MNIEKKNVEDILSQVNDNIDKELVVSNDTSLITKGNAIIKNIFTLPGNLLNDAKLIKNSNEVYFLIIFLIGYVLFITWDVYKKYKTRL